MSQKSFFGKVLSSFKSTPRSEENDQDSGDKSAMYTQKQTQLLRSKEASKQMLYGTYGNVISILEEFERREMEAMGQRRHMPKSNIPIPSQSHKGFDDVESNVNTQILLFETQTKACPPEVLAELKDELTRKTLSWAAVRAEMGIKEVHKTDKFVSKLYEVLARGSTHHEIPNSSGVTKATMRESFQAILKGTHDKNTVDEEFRRDKARRASAPYTRNSEMLHEGAQRLSRARGNRDLDHYLHKDVQKFYRQGPSDLK